MSARRKRACQEKIGILARLLVGYGAVERLQSPAGRVIAAIDALHKDAIDPGSAVVILEALSAVEIGVVILEALSAVEIGDDGSQLHAFAVSLREAASRHAVLAREEDYWERALEAVAASPVSEVLEAIVGARESVELAIRHAVRSVGGTGISQEQLRTIHPEVSW
jgi:hypothetical protein